MKTLHQRAAAVAVFLLGLALVVYGVGRYSRPAGYVVAGLLLSAGSALVHDRLKGGA